LEASTNGKLYWRCVLCNVWVTKAHLEGNKHHQKRSNLTKYQVEAGNLPAQAWSQQNQVHVQIPTIPELETSVDRLHCNIGLLEKQVDELRGVATKLVEDMKTNTERIVALESLVAKAIGEKFDMTEKLEKAAKLIAELEKRVAAVEPRESSSCWSGGGQVGKWQNNKWLAYEPTPAKKAGWDTSSSSTWWDDQAGTWQNCERLSYKPTTDKQSGWDPSSSSPW